MGYLGEIGREEPLHQTKANPKQKESKALTIKLPQNPIDRARAATARHADAEFVGVV
jgi:hypothetical protein